MDLLSADGFTALHEACRNGVCVCVCVRVLMSVWRCESCETALGPLQGPRSETA